MHTLEILDNGQKLQFPAKVAEFSPQQYISFCESFLKQRDGEFSYDDFMVALVYNCLEMKPLRNRRMKEDERYQVVQNLEYLSETLLSFWAVNEKGDAEIDWFFTDQKIKSIVMHDRTLFGPAEMLADLTYGEYEKAHTYYSVYLKTGDDNMINKLVACLYRPAKKRTGSYVQDGVLPPGTKRMAIDELDMQLHEAYVSAIPRHIKYAVFVWWLNMEAFIPMAQIDTDAGKVLLEDLFKELEEKSSSIENNTGIRGVLYQLAESKVFGELKQVEQTPFWDVMLRLYQLRKNYEADLHRLEQMRSKGGTSD